MKPECRASCVASTGFLRAVADFSLRRMRTWRPAALPPDHESFAAFVRRSVDCSRRVEGPECAIAVPLDGSRGKRVRHEGIGRAIESLIAPVCQVPVLDSPGPQVCPRIGSRNVERCEVRRELPGEIDGPLHGLRRLALVAEHERAANVDPRLSCHRHDRPHATQIEVLVDHLLHFRIAAFPAVR